MIKKEYNNNNRTTTKLNENHQKKREEDYDIIYKIRENSKHYLLNIRKINHHF